MRGADKLTQDVRGQALLRDRAQMFLASQLTHVVVVLRPDRPERLSALDGLKVEITINHQAAKGMASSIQAGLTALKSDADAVLIMPADMPDITSDDIDAMLKVHAKEPHTIRRATTADGVPGSPVIFPRDSFAALQALQGDESGRAVLKAQADHVQFHKLSGTRASTDLDTPEDWAAWRALKT